MVEEYLVWLEMFTTSYAEVAPYCMQEEFPPTNEPLPSSHKLSWQMPDPWMRRSKCKEDFVLLAEFSEIEGPKPVLTIPLNVKTDLDINEFCVRIMSVDSQSQPGESFKLHRETSTILCSRQTEVHSFVHHFTLYDSKARGFVRPFCVAFITSDERKVVRWMNDLESEFETVTKLLMDSNLPTFLTDMTHYLSDLRYTKEAQRECSDVECDLDLTFDPILQSVSAESLQTAIAEVKHVLHVVSSAIYSPDATPQTVEAMYERVSARTASISSTRSNTGVSFQYSSSLNVGEQLIPDSELNSMSPRQRRHRSASSSSDSRIYNGSSCGTAPSGSESEPGGSEGSASPYCPQLVRTTNKRRYDRTLRDLEQLSPAGHKAAIARLHYIKALYSKSYPELMIEELDASMVQSSPGLLTVGANVLINFLPDRSDLNCKDVNEGLMTGETTTNPQQDSGLTRVVFSTSLDNLKAFCDNGLLLPSSMDCTEEESDSPPSTEGGQSDTLFDSGVSSDESVTLHENSGPDQEESHDDECSDSRPVRVYSITDAIGILNFNTPGLGLLKLSRHFSFTPHLLYSLLIGRPVVVLGNQRKASIVQEVLRTLLFLIPGASSNLISLKPLSRPLALPDLDQLLVGVARPCTGPARHEPYVGRELEGYCTALDMDKRAMYGPSYLGGILEQIHTARKIHVSDRSYLAFVHSLLSVLALKSYIFYHTFILNVSSKLPAMYSTPAEAAVAYKKAQQHFCTSLRTSLHDGDVVRHLAEVVHAQIEGNNLPIEKLGEVNFQLYKS